MCNMRALNIYLPIILVVAIPMAICTVIIEGCKLALEGCKHVFGYKKKNDLENHIVSGSCSPASQGMFSQSSEQSSAAASPMPDPTPEVSALVSKPG